MHSSLSVIHLAILILILPAFMIDKSERILIEFS